MLVKMTAWCEIWDIKVLNEFPKTLFSPSMDCMVTAMSLEKMNTFLKRFLPEKKNASEIF